MTRFNILLHEGVDMVLWALENSLGGEIFVPKIPSFNILELAEAIGPNCKKEIIGIRPGEKLHEEMISANDSLNSLDLGNYYADYIRAMNHWHNVFGKDIFTVHYDNVINNTEETIKELIDYCELPFEKQCLEFYKSSRPVKTPSAEQVRQPIYKSGLNYWKNYEKHLNSLKKIIDEIN